MGKKDQIVFVGYVGTTKIAFLQARISLRGSVEVLALSTKLAEGFENGCVKDLARASETIAQAVREVIGHRLDTAVPCRLVVSNPALKNYTFESSLYFTDNPHVLTMKDVRHAIAQTRSVATIPLREVIVQSVPQEFLVNDIAGVCNPIGLEASRLGVKLRLVTLDILGYNNLLKVFEHCDLDVVNVIPNVLAAANTVLTEAEKQSGVVLVSIGGTATHFACFKNSVLMEVSSIAFGADHITDAIAKNFNMEYLDAQRLKETFGSATPKFEFQEELIPVPETNGRKKYHIPRKEFETHIQASVDAFFNELKKYVTALQERHLPISQVVFTGGGARLDGFLEVARETVSSFARIGVPLNVDGSETLISNPSFSGALGGIGFSTRVAEQEGVSSERQHWLARSIDNIKNWIFEYF